MRTSFSVLVVVAAAAFLLSGQDKAGMDPQSRFDAHDLAAYATNAMIQYVNPGLVFSVVSANITSAGVISVTYKVTDPTGLALDITGIQTPGTISSSFLVAYIPKTVAMPGLNQYTSYITKVATAVTGGATATQPTADSGGTTTTIAVGEYTYTFKTQAPSGFDPTATHRIGIYGSRNLTTWDLGTNYASVTYDFVPNGGTPAPRDIVRTADCDKCHYQLAFHGGSRRGTDLCIMCHQPQNSDPNTGNSLDFPVLIHQVHIGTSFPTIQSTTPYAIEGFGNVLDSWTGVVFPGVDVRNCAKTCHNPNNGAAQTSAWLTTPNRAACGACHSNIDFATGLNHGTAPGNGLPEIDDSQCADCHIPQGELDFDASIVGAHVIPEYSTSVPGINITLTKVTNGVDRAKANDLLHHHEQRRTADSDELSFARTAARCRSPCRAPHPTTAARASARLSDHPRDTTRKAPSRGPPAPARRLHVHLHQRHSGQRHGHLHDRRRMPREHHPAARNHPGDHRHLQRPQLRHQLLGGWLGGDAAAHGGARGQLQQLPRRTWRCTARCGTT